MGVGSDLPVPDGAELVDVSGMTLADARATLTEAQFDAPVRTEDRLVNDPEQDGVVIATQPAAGTKVARDEPITLLVGDDPFQR